MVNNVLIRSEYSFAAHDEITDVLTAFAASNATTAALAEHRHVALHARVLGGFDTFTDDAQKILHRLFRGALFFQVQRVELRLNRFSQVVRGGVVRDCVRRFAPRVQMRVRGGGRLQPRKVRLSSVRLD